MFENIIGHEKQKELLKKVISKNEISHAYLFTGPEGIGKQLVAKEFAKVLLDTNNLETCLDFKLINREEGKKDLSVEKIRKELIEDVYIAPSMSKNKVYIINDGMYLNIAAQNALLKTLEEPPNNVHIIIISENSGTFLPTILSRITQINFSPLKISDVEEYIKKMYNKELNENILDFFNGSIGKAKNAIENDEIKKYDYVEKIYKAIKAKDVISALNMDIEHIFENFEFLKYFEYLIQKDNDFSRINFVEKAYNRLKNNGNYDIVIDNMIIGMVNSL